MRSKGVFSAAILTAVLCIGGNLLAYSGGDGNSVNPYKIANVADWQALMGTSTDWNKQFLLIADVNLAGVTLTPVGNDSTPFTGVFNGNGNIISNAVINQPGSDKIGLFGYVNNSNILNLGVENVNINGRLMVGGLAGHNWGGITACYATGSVTGTFTGYSYVGGLVGYNSGGLIACYATSSVSGGGVGGRIGGLVGENNGGITYCYATGSVDGNSVVGGLVGGSTGGYTTSCFWDIQTSGTSDGVGNQTPDPAWVIGKSTAEMKKLSTFTSEPNNWDFTNETTNGTNDYWRMCADGVDYPRLNWESTKGDLACPDGVSFVDFAYFAEHRSTIGCSSPNNYCGGADMNYSGTVDFADFAIFANNWLEGI
jgi:hypothetical protein